MLQKIIILVFIILLSNIWLSCNNSNEEIKSKLDSALKEMNSIKVQKIKDSINNAQNLTKLMDSLNKAIGGNINDLNALYELLKPSIFIVYTFDGELNKYQGSAFIIDENGVCLSNYHLFENISSGYVVNQEGLKFKIERIISYSKESDYIIFKIALGNYYLSPLKVTTLQPRIGEQCFAIGNPKGLMHTLSTGIISGIRDGGKYLQTTAEITHGSSGGALFNSKGEVIGITSAGLNEANLNFAINILHVDKVHSISETNNAGRNVKNFTVTSPKAFFHNSPSNSQRRNAYMVYGEYGQALEEINGFIYVVFTNSKGQTSIGWIQTKDVEFGNFKINNSRNYSTSSEYEVIVDKAIFHSSPDFNTSRRGYLVRGETFKAIAYRNGFIYTEFVNRNGIKSIGWINENDVLLK
ncbi:MAG: S1C family serine protease [Hydrotalea sp.]|nr:S1C family serine protease [Hydrotalea sp.]